ncbi:AI-2E family transporter [Sphingomonas koreensis]|nr:AI-2E family transporter [Sphingomonas koreensis]
MNRLRPDEPDTRFIRRIVIIIAIAGVLWALLRAGDILILAFGSSLGAIAIHAIAEGYEKRLRLPEKAALGAGIVTALGIVGFLFWLFGVQFAPQINLLVAQLPHLLDQLAAWLSHSPVGAKLVSAVQSAYSGSRAAQDVSGIAQGAGTLLLNVLLLIVGAVFFAANPEIYRRGLLMLVPQPRRPAFADAFDDVSDTLRLWLRTQLILMTTMGVLVGLGLWIAGVPSSAALGLLAGLSEFIPYIGPTAAMLPAIGLGATVSTHAVIGTLITYAAVRMIQTNFITPFVQHRVIEIPPAVTLFSIIAIGMVFGLYALFFSAAMLVVIFTLIRTLYLREVLGEDIGAPGDN